LVEHRQLFVIELLEEVVPLNRLQRRIAGPAGHVDAQQSGFFVAFLGAGDGCWLAARASTQWRISLWSVVRLESCLDLTVMAEPPMQIELLNKNAAEI